MEEETKESLPEQFWREYEEADLLEREEKLKPLVEKISRILEIEDKKLRSHVLKMLLLSYFDDILEYKNQIEDD